MSLCYLYSKSSSYPHQQELLQAFKKSVTLEIETIQIIDDFDIYIIELYQADKEISKKLVNLFKKRKHSLIYFIIPKNYTLLLFQLTFLLETKSIITHNQNIEKTITKIKTDREIFIQNNLERWIGHLKLQTQNFIIYQNSHLIFVSQSLLGLFSSQDNSLFELDILSQVDIKTLLTNNTSITLHVQDNTNTQNKYIFKSVSASDNETIIYIDKNNTQGKKLSLLSSRFAFIELLKENILQRNVNYKELGLLTINIQNIKNLLTQYKVVEFEDVLLEMLLFMESILENKLIFAQLEKHFYVVCFEDMTFEQLNVMTEYFHKKILNHINTTDNRINIDLFTVSLKNHEFSTVLTTLNQIENGDLKENLNNDSYIKHFSNPNREVNAKSLLDDAYQEKLTFKILNIYNGLVINSSSKILKVTEEHVYISFEALQGVILNLEKATVIQSDTFSQDIYAEVKQINLSKRVAVLENFRFLKTNANSREYARVTTPIKIPIVVNTSGKIVNGFILDISIKSIAIRVKHIPKIPILEKNKVSLVFNILDKASEDGYLQLHLSANIIVVTKIDESNHYKIVCDLDQDSHDLDIVLQYVYERQKELIIELKKMAKLN
ncbi:MAG: hypothetical protein ACI9TV_001042 [Sulfurimonas sp.]|uniref:PilZ domain-containing protein n=1 Tax=Sulfurimonas sp. TaxID=2022749 RepID=UPI0039E54BDC